MAKKSEVRNSWHLTVSSRQILWRGLCLLPVIYCLLNMTPVLAQQGVDQDDFGLEAIVSENQIFIGEQFSLSVEMSGSSMRDVSLPELPEIDGVRVLSHNPSRGTSISVINGRTTTSSTYTWSLIAREAGRFTIPPISMMIDGEERQTQPIQIEIIERSGLTTDGNRQALDIFVEIEVDDDNPVPGQQIIASLVLYFKQGMEVTSFQPAAGWRTDGFWKEQLENIRQPRAESVIIGGVRYRTATLMRYALFPNRSGELTLSEFSINLSVRSQPSRDDPFGSFFGRSGLNQRRVTIETEPVHLRIRPLPALSEQAVTMNAVGNLNIRRRINRNEVATGETIELITEIEGTGNIPLIRRPAYNLPDGLDLYTPQEESNVERRGENIRGEKTFRELLVARAPGIYEIPAERIAVYNPQRQQYQYTNLPALRFEALPGTGTQLASSGSAPFRLQPVSGLAVWNSGSSIPFYRTIWFWVLFVVPAIAFAAGLRHKKLRDRLASDSMFARAHRANEQAKKQIEQARLMVGNDQPKEAYNYMHKAVSGFITDKLGLPRAGLSDPELIEKVREQGCNGTLVKSLRGLLTKCATINYAPVGEREEFREDIKKAEQLIAELKREL